MKKMKGGKMKKIKSREDEEDLGVYIYRPRTAFTDIDQKGSTVELIRHPLMLRLVMSSFHRRVLPSNLTDDEIMPIFIEQIIETV